MQDTAAERARFASAIGKVALLTSKNEKPDKATLKVYFAALRHFNIGTIEQVADEIIAVETELITVPPPGRWREIAERLFELREPIYKDPRAVRKCNACEDTGWRPAEYGPGVVACECKRGGEAPPVHLGMLQTPLPDPSKMLPVSNEAFPPRDGETDIEKRRREWGNQLLTCACCGEPYRRRSGWRCCAPPGGMKYAVWTRQWHENCGGQGKHRCPNHCPHPKSERPSNFPVPAQGESMRDWAVRMGFRDPNAPDEPEQGGNDAGF